MNLTVYFLDNANWDNKVIPSPSIYFGKYPYRVTLNRTLANWQDYQDMHLEFSMFIQDNCTGNFRRLFNRYTQRLYLSSWDDLNTIYNWYGSDISEVNGPVSQNHCDILSDPTQTYAHKPNGFFRKYNTRFELVPNWKIPFSERRQMVNDITDTLKQLVSDLKISREYSRSRYNCVSYMQYDEYLEALPFIKLSYPNVRTYVTRTQLPD